MASCDIPIFKEKKISQVQNLAVGSMTQESEFNLSKKGRTIQ